MNEPFHERSSPVSGVSLLYTSSASSVSGCAMRDRGLLTEAKECQGRDCANLVPLSPPCIHAADGPYLGTIKQGPRCPVVVHLFSEPGRQTGCPKSIKRPRTSLIKEDKLGLASKSCLNDTINQKLLNDHILQVDLQCQVVAVISNG